MGLFDKLFKRNKEQEVAKETLDKGLEKTKESFFSRITKAVAGKSTVDADVLDSVEDALIMADVGVQTTIEIIRRIEERVAKDKYLGTSELNRILQEEMANILTDAPALEYQKFELPEGKKPYVILVVGVNGVGKTTTIGKLAYNYKRSGKQVLLGAADTFRAAAVNQLTIWSERVDVPIVKRNKEVIQLL
jgi:fused signal recognition particle receptor